MSELTDILTNPVLRKALLLISPEAVLAAELAALIIQGFNLLGDSKETIFIRIMDQRFAFLVKEISESKTELSRVELEIRLHELLSILLKTKEAWK